LVVIGAVAVAEPILLLGASRKPAGFAAVVLAVQVAGALLAFGFALHRDKTPPKDGDDLLVRVQATPELAAAVSPEPA
jgi:hypothetical protein